MDHETSIRAQTPYIEVCDNTVCRRYEPGSQEYEGWLARAVAEHVAADLDVARAAEIEDDRQQAITLYQALKAGTATNRQVQGVLAFLLRREMT